MEIVVSKTAPRRVPLAQLTLIHDHSAPSYGFVLSGVLEEGAMTFTFIASSKDDRKQWIRELRDLTAESGTSATTHTSSVPTTPPGKDATARHQAHEEMTDLATSTPERPVKRGGLVYTVPPKMTHIILVRHGHYINAHAKNVSDADQVLSQMGRQQAELTGKYLEELYHRCPARHQEIALYHSDLARAVETATVISKNFSSGTSTTPVPCSLLREGWPGQPFASDQMPAHMRNRDQDESELDQLDLARMGEAYDKYFSDSDDGNECLFRVIVCHANLIRYFLCRALRIDPRGVWGHLEINHCGVSRIDLCNKRPLKVQAINETGHLPHSLTTSSEDHL
jgi:broad specificity phosphatase PhoE